MTVCDDLFNQFCEYSCLQGRACRVSLAVFGPHSSTRLPPVWPRRLPALRRGSHIGSAESVLDKGLGPDHDEARARSEDRAEKRNQLLLHKLEVSLHIVAFTVGAIYPPLQVKYSGLEHICHIVSDFPSSLNVNGTMRAGLSRVELR